MGFPRLRIAMPLQDLRSRITILHLLGLQCLSGFFTTKHAWVAQVVSLILIQSLVIPKVVKTYLGRL